VNIKTINTHISRKRCPFDRVEKNELSFSLMDYRNGLFTSNDPKKVMEFYDGFENCGELIQWMKERPRGASYIHEVEGDKDIIVVIPTADFNGKYAVNCRENIFRGLHMIFVESGEIPDPYFNGAHNVNIGVKRAMEYNPKWIVFSNDDMYKIDDVDVLKNQLHNIEEKNYNVAFTKPSEYHSTLSRIIEVNSFYNLFHLITNYDAGRVRMKQYKKFNIDYTSMKSKYAPFFSFPRRGYKFIEALDFLILSHRLVEQTEGYIFDETYINGREDVDLSLRISLGGEKYAVIDYRIGDYIGSTIGINSNRWIRDVANLCYFNFKWRNDLQKIISS